MTAQEKLVEQHFDRREKLLKAHDDASQRYKSSTQKERKAFFHGPLPI